VASNKFICIHGHFYQPPRENAWLEVIEIQDSAHPYHDWNERISAECYGPNTASRILDKVGGVIKNITNNYARISFNFGPTLLSWMEVYDKETYEGILEADRESIKRFDGHGSAMAQVFNHMIMPLANRRDKETQVIWGIRDFEKRFSRKPEGMWLAETAVDTESLEILAEQGIPFTVLAPRQAKSIRKIGDMDWTAVTDQTINTRKAYRCTLPSGKSIILFFYDGNISQSVAFNGLLNDGRAFAERLINALDQNDQSHQLVHIATDGETYGHHHKHGEMALAFALDFIEKHNDVNLINYASYAAQFEPELEAQIIEDSSWSCVHGVERWRENCGCNSGKPGYTQTWRKPLRDALDWLRDTLSVIFESEASNFFKDPWEARNEYIKVVLKRTDENVNRFIRLHGLNEQIDVNKALRLMELQRHAMLMYTSCGWFFDEISGIETVQVIQYACRAIQLSKQLTEKDLEAEFLTRLELAPSNVATYENGGNVFRKLVLPSKTNLTRVGMHYAVSSIFEDDPENLPLFNYKATNEFFVKKEAGEQKLVTGITKVQSLVTRSEKKFAFAVIYLGKHDLIGNLSLDIELDNFFGMQFRMVNAFEEGRLADVISIMQTYFGSEKYSIWSLFKEEKRKILDAISHQGMEDLESSLRRTYNRDYPLVNALSNNDIPIPKAYRTTFEYILNADLLRCFQPDKINVKSVERIVTELDHWNLKIEDTDKVERLAGDSIFKEIKRVRAERHNVKRIERLNRLFPVMRKFKLDPNLHQSQNLYFEMSVENKGSKMQDLPEEWISQFNLLGDNLGVKVE
jgi:alpha-amylase/alpha-mannosidase (GH57 family)